MANIPKTSRNAEVRHHPANALPCLEGLQLAPVRTGGLRIETAAHSTLSEIMSQSSTLNDPKPQRGHSPKFCIHTCLNPGTDLCGHDFRGQLLQESKSGAEAYAIYCRGVFHVVPGLFTEGIKQLGVPRGGLVLAWVADLVLSRTLAQRTPHRSWQEKKLAGDKQQAASSKQQRGRGCQESVFVRGLRAPFLIHPCPN